MSLDVLRFLVSSGGPGNGPVPVPTDLERVISRHNLQAYAFHFLNSSLSPRFREECATHYRFQKIITSLYLSELTRLQKIFVDEGESAIVYKGGALVPELFDDCGSRLMSDIDIWVRPERMERVLDLFKTAGYRDKEVPNWEAGEGKKVFTKDHGQFFTDFEIHKKNYSFESQPVFSLSHENGICAPNVEEHFLMLVIHAGYQHTFTELKWWIDIVFFLRKYIRDLNWQRLAELCRAHEMTRLMANVLAMVEMTDENLKHPKDLFQARRITKFDADFLVNPSQGSYRYYYLKHVLKENLGRTLRYDALWLKSRLLPKRPANSSVDT